MFLSRGFLSELAKKIYEQHHGSIDSLSLVFPSSKAAYAFRRAFAQQLSQPHWGFASYLLPGFMQYLLPTSLPTLSTLLQHLYKVMLSLNNAPTSFTHFYRWGRTFLQDIEDMAQHQVSINALLGNEKTAREDALTKVQKDNVRSFWDAMKQLPNKQHALLGGTWDKWYRVYKAFHLYLDEHNLTYKGRYYQQIYEQLLQKKTRPQYGHVIMVGVHPITPVVTAIFRLLAEKLDYYVEVDAYYMTSADEEAGRYLRTYQRDPLFGKHLPAPLPSNINRNTKVNLLVTPSRHEQLHALVQQLEKIASSPHFKPNQVTVALADTSLLIPLLHVLPAWPISVELDYPLYHTPLYALLLLVIDWYDHCQQQEKRPENGYTLLETLQHHPYLTLDEALFETLLTAWSKHHYDTAKIKELPTLWHHLLGAKTTPSNIIAYLAEFLSLLMACPRDVSWTSWEVLAMNVAMDWCSEQMRLLDLLSLPNDDWSGGFLQESLRSLLLPTIRKNNKGLSIVCVEDTACLDIPYLFVLSMNEGIFPRVRQPSLLPPKLRKICLPTQAYRETKAAYLFYRWLHSTQQLYLCYYQRKNRHQTVEPSRFIQQLQYVSPCTIETHFFASEVSLPTPQPIVVNKNVAEVGLHAFVGKEARKTLTPSIINTYLDCKLRFYFKYIAKLASPTPSHDLKLAGVFGQLLHQAMEALYLPYVGKVIDRGCMASLKGKKIEQTVAEVCRQAVEEIPPTNKGTRHFMQALITKLAERIRFLDEQYAPFTLLHVEKSIKTHYELPDGRVVALGGIIDRVDEKAGTVRVVDYKTSIFKPQIGKLRSLFDTTVLRNTTAFQALWYAWLYARNTQQFDDIAAVQPTIISTRHLFNPSPPTRLWVLDDARKRRPIKDIRAYATAFEKKITAVLVELFDTVASFDQTLVLSYCRQCPYNTICQRGE